MASGTIDSDEPAAGKRPGSIWRWIFTVHRYLGIAVGLITLLWCLSGIVMMYVPYPTLSVSERLRGLDTLDLEQCCDSRTLASHDAVIVVDSYSVETFVDRPVLRATLTTGENVTFDLLDGHEIRPPARSSLLAAGAAFGTNSEFPEPFALENVLVDQWTVQESNNRHRPFIRYSAADGSEWYISTRNGEIVQMTGRSERIGNWFGAVIHWLYPTLLRQNGAVWSQLVIWITIAALFLVVTGIIHGVKRLRWPYSGLSRWHQYAGLSGAIFALTWLFSGLLSMNPYGALESRSYASERELLRGSPPTLAAVYRHLAEVRDFVPRDAVRIESNLLEGEMQSIAAARNGSRIRLASDGPLSPVELDVNVRTAKRIRPGVLVDSAVTLSEGDAYYYAHRGSAPFPVHRIVFRDGERFYFSPQTGGIALAVDANRRWYRWLFQALHTGDFHAIARQRPLWDLWMLLLLAGLVIGTGTGTVLAYRALSR